MKRTTVVIPNYNGIQYIEECLRSVMEQSEESYDVLVIDNGSKDASLEWIKEHYPGIHCIALGRNTGFSYAVNVGIENAKTPYVLLLNNDTVVDYEFIKSLTDHISNSKRIFSVSAKMIDLKSRVYLDGAGDLYNALGWGSARGKGKDREKYSRPCRIFSACAGAAIYRKEILDEIGDFDVEHFAYLEDVDLGYRALIYGYENWYEPNAIVYHAGSAVSGSRHNAFKVRLSARNNIYMLAKNMPFLQIIINLPFLVLGTLIKLLFFFIKGLANEYFQGIIEGFRLAMSHPGRNHKVAFAGKHLPSYLLIQWMLWVNIFRRFIS